MRAVGVEPTRALRPCGFSYRLRLSPLTPPRLPRFGGFAVWTIPSPYSATLEVRRCPSSLYTFLKHCFRLGSGSPVKVSPNLSSSASPVSRRALKFAFKSSASAIPPRPHGWLQHPIIQAAKLNLHVSFRGQCPWPVLCFCLCSGLVFDYFLGLWPHGIDRGGVKVGLDMRCVVFLDHLDAGAAVFGDLIDVGAFHQAETYMDL